MRTGNQLWLGGLGGFSRQLFPGFNVIRFEAQGLDIVISGLLPLALPGERHAEIEVSLGIIGVEFQGLFIMENRLIQEALFSHRITQIIVRLGIIGL